MQGAAWGEELASCFQAAPLGNGMYGSPVIAFLHSGSLIARHETKYSVMATNYVAHFQDFAPLESRTVPPSIDDLSIRFCRAAFRSSWQDTAGCRFIRWLSEAAANTELASNNPDGQLLRHPCPSQSEYTSIPHRRAQPPV